MKLPPKIPPNAVSIAFQPDADEIEKMPVARGLPVTLYACIALLASFLAWAAVAQLDQVVVGTGRLISTEPNIIIQPLETAMIESLPVTVGQVVKRGELLARLEPTFINADLAQVRERLVSLNAQVRRLEAERAGRPTGGQDALQQSLDLEKQSAYRARLARLDENLDKTSASLLNAQAEIRIFEKRLANQTEIEKMMQELVQKEFQSRRALLDVSEKRLEIERDLLSARNRAAELSREITGLKSDRSAFSNEFKLKSLEELVTARRERDSLQEQLSKSERRNTLVDMTAPVDGIVLEVARKSRGSVIKEGETIVSLVPLGGSLLAEVRIDAAEVSFVRPGADVRVKLNAFPFQKFGLIEGRLTKLSADALEAPAGGRSGQTYYTGIVELRKYDPSLRTPDIELKVGMTLSAEIMTQQRSVLSYLTYPIRQVRSEAMNER